MAYQGVDKQKLRERFERFAKNECNEISPLY